MFELTVSITSHTPAWVFIAFAVLIVIGMCQIQPHIVSRRRLIMLPPMVAAHSLHGVSIASHASPPTLMMWLVTVVVAFLMTYMLPPNDVISETARTAYVPGSWMPIVVIVGLLAARCTCDVVPVVHPGILHSGNFMVLFNALLGFLDSLLLSRSVLLYVRTPCLMMTWTSNRR